MFHHLGKPGQFTAGNWRQKQKWRSQRNIAYWLAQLPFSPSPRIPDEQKNHSKWTSSPKISNQKVLHRYTQRAV